MKEKAFELANIWAKTEYFDKIDREEIQKLLSKPEENEVEIIDRFYKNIEFGTGGLRSVLGIGPNRMNKYNIRKATQAMALAVLAIKPKGARACISYDNRKFSEDFAKQVACVFAANGIKTYIYDEMTPTPMLSYAVRYYEADCGVMVTASHNPKQYNGFKAYWNDGAQVTPPYDQNITDYYNNLDSWDEIKIIDFEKAQNEELIDWVSKECTDSFYKIIEDDVINKEMCKKDGDKLHVIYTPLHGCGHIPCKYISHKLGFTNFELVESQAVADPAFSTVRSTPNPEDPIALEMAVALMEEANADLTYGTDPDCDRLGVVVNHRGSVEYLNGNQIALLMIDYIFKQKTKNNTLPKNPLVIKSIVTSPMQKTIVESFDGTVLDTLTGFKWMAKLWKDLEDQNTDYNFVFASEESFGYMPNNQVRDKDAVASVALMNELALFHKLEGKTLIDALDEIYSEYGYAEESLIALNFEGLSGREKINSIMKYFRENPTLDIAENKIKIFKDFSTQIEKNITTEEEIKIEMTKSDVLGFEFESGDLLFLRPSGTEPKIKFYTMVQVKEGELTEKKKEAKARIKKIELFIHNQIEKI